MENKNMIIIILVCVFVVLAALTAFSMMSAPNQQKQIQNSTNATNDSVTVESVTQEDQKSSGSGKSTHTEHLHGGDVEVDENGMVVGSYNSKGQYFPGGQMGGMSIEEARAFDERAYKYGLS